MSMTAVKMGEVDRALAEIDTRRHEANHSFPRLDYCFPAIELSNIVAAGKLLHGVDVSARLNTKLVGLFRFSGFHSMRSC